jgi:hypothetical protein
MFKTRTFILILVLSLTAATFVISCNNQETSTTTESEINQFSNIRFALSINSHIEKGIFFENLEIATGVLKESVLISDPESDRKYEAGEKCLLLSGDIKNDTDRDLIVAVFATGYNQNLKRVSWTLSSARIVGQDDFTVLAHSTSPFVLIQSWADNILYFEIGAQTFTEEEYYPD